MQIFAKIMNIFAFCLFFTRFFRAKLFLGIFSLFYPLNYNKIIQFLEIRD